MAASIIFLRAGTRRVFPVEIFLSREVAPLSAICIVSSTSSICSSFCCCFVCILLTGRGCLSCGPEKDRFVRLAAVASGNSIIDGTKGFVQALGICCGAETTFTGSGFLFWLFLALSPLPFVWGVWYFLPLVPRRLRIVELMVVLKRAVLLLLGWLERPMRFSMGWGLGSWWIVWSWVLCVIVFVMFLLCVPLPVSLGRGDWWWHAPAHSLRTLVFLCPGTGSMRASPRSTCRSGPRTCRSWPGGQTSGSCSTAVADSQRASSGSSRTLW